jgi:hypothetical protein
MVAIRAVAFCFFPLAESFVQLKEGVTDLASELSPFVPVVVVEVVMGSIATGTYKVFRHGWRGWAIFHGR